ncbi:E3 ubiquitin-protein ligase TRIM21-like [Siniperca chuatsi]|uniref:E3 ubiquitin-protein ligase TRIM21-like n=1 Tax=Siniperca chuatsi TaxID=119488 RepID=UPI001CE10755|nr:E3 ubiquitin-protein ligase TRIM21-like [Siniperca chuatsi]
MAAQFRQSAQQKASSSSSEQQVARPGEVPCDVCTGTKLKGLKSCLVCLASYCETHLEPHLTASRLKRHQLINSVEKLEGRMCTKHDKLLELFCKTDQTCVCLLCTVLDHKRHDVVPLKEEYEDKKAELGKTEQLIQERRLKIQEIKRSVELSKEDADREIAGGVQVFTALKESVERSQAELIDTIREKQRKTEKQADGFIQELEQEISKLKKRSSELEQLSRTEDIHLLQSLPSLNAAPPTKDWTEVSVRPPSYEGTVVRAVNQLEETLSKQMKKLFEAELKRVQQYAVAVTLDPDTANPWLILSDDGKQVKHGEVFTTRFRLKGRESVNRKGQITLNPQEGYWTICLRNENEYKAAAGPAVRLSLKSQPETVGVFVDYEEGLVSFYEADAAALIYSFTGCFFTEKLYPFFCPYPNTGGKTPPL